MVYRKEAVAIFYATALAIAANSMGLIPKIQSFANASASPDSKRGATLLASYGCSSCHQIPYIYGTPGTIAQPLGKWAERSFIAGRFPNNKKNLVNWIRFPQKLKPGTAMPNLNVSEEEAQNMASYLYEH